MSNRYVRDLQWHVLGHESELVDRVLSFEVGVMGEEREQSNEGNFPSFLTYKRKFTRQSRVAHEKVEAKKEDDLRSDRRLLDLTNCTT
jgi:hypothetical protein